MTFCTLPQGPLWLSNVTVPARLLGQPGDLIRVDLHLADGQISAGGGTRVDMAGALVLPCFMDVHTHLDKGHIWPRTPNPDGTFASAIAAVAEDKAALWTADDLRARMTFALRCAYAHGTSAIRTHLDSSPPQDQITWPVFRDVQQDWADRIALQGVSLMALDKIGFDASFAETVDRVAENGGVLGAVTLPSPQMQSNLEQFLATAMDRGLEVDFHVDETLDPGAETLRKIAQTVLKMGFDQPVTVGHCCSLATQPEARALETLDLVAQAGLHVVSLPMCNLYLQDRQTGRTPRQRGITLVHEMAARGIRVSFASDNTRDPFYAYGDLDIVEVLREATRIGHLDHSDGTWIHSVLGTPARAMSRPAPSLRPGAPADLVMFSARNWSEFFARPQSDRSVLRAGVQIATTLPAYSELDHLAHMR